MTIIASCHLSAVKLILVPRQFLIPAQLLLLPLLLHHELGHLLIPWNLRGLLQLPESSGVKLGGGCVVAFPSMLLLGFGFLPSAFLSDLSNSPIFISWSRS